MQDTTHNFLICSEGLACSGISAVYCFCFGFSFPVVSSRQSFLATSRDPRSEDRSSSPGKNCYHVSHTMIDRAADFVFRYHLRYPFATISWTQDCNCLPTRGSSTSSWYTFMLVYHVCSYAFCVCSRHCRTVRAGFFSPSH